jgi:hypothetical protein
MSSQRDDVAVTRFAVQSDDWQLVGVLAEFLERESTGWPGVACSAYLTLSGRLRLDGDVQ